MVKIVEKYPILTLFVLVALMMLPSLEHLRVTIMEARNFITAREMLGDGNWVLTTMNGLPRYEKPPLPTWITAIFGLIFGIKNILALRLPGVIMVWIIGVYTYFLSNKMGSNKQHSFVNSIIVVTSFYVVGIVIEAPWDIYTHGFMLVAIYHLYLAYTANKKLDIIVAIFFIACSVLSKGPISVFALLLPFLIAYVVVYGPKNKFVVKTLLSLGLGAALGSLWYIYVRLADTEAFMKIAEVETSNWSSYQVKPFYYYWSFFIQSGIWTIPAFVSLLYPYLKNRVGNLKAYRLSFFWTIFAVVLLSLVPEKKARYLMPVLIPLAINTGFYIQYLISHFKQLKLKAELVPVYFHFGLLGIIALFFPLGVYLFLPEEFKQNIWLILLLTPILLLSGGGIFYFLVKKNIHYVFYLSIVFYVTIMLLIVPVNPGFSNQNINYKSISNLKAEVKNENLPIYVLDLISPEMLWDFGGKIPMVEQIDSVYHLPNKQKFGLLVTDKSLVEDGDFYKSYEIEKKETYDINIGAFNSRKHKYRYINYFYIFQKKE